MSHRRDATGLNYRFTSSINKPEDVETSVGLQEKLHSLLSKTVKDNILSLSEVFCGSNLSLNDGNSSIPKSKSSRESGDAERNDRRLEEKKQQTNHENTNNTGCGVRVAVRTDPSDETTLAPTPRYSLPTGSLNTGAEGRGDTKVQKCLQKGSSAPTVCPDDLQLLSSRRSGTCWGRCNGSRSHRLAQSWSVRVPAERTGT